MPNIEDITAPLSVKIADNKTEQLFLSTIDLKYAFGQIDLQEDTSKHNVFTMIGGKKNGTLPIHKMFKGTNRNPREIDRTLKLATPALPDDIIVVTKGNSLQHFNDPDHILEI